MSDHDDLLAVAARWERLYREEREMAEGWQRRNLEIVADLKAENARLRAALLAKGEPL